MGHTSFCSALMIVYLVRHTDYKGKNESVIGHSKKIGPEVNAQDAKYMFMSHEQNAVQNHNVKIGDKPFENIAKFKYTETTLTN